MEHLGIFAITFSFIELREPAFVENATSVFFVNDNVAIVN